MDNISIISLKNARNVYVPYNILQTTSHKEDLDKFGIKIMKIMVIIMIVRNLRGLRFLR